MRSLILLSILATYVSCSTYYSPFDYNRQSYTPYSRPYSSPKGYGYGNSVERHYGYDNRARSPHYRKAVSNFGGSRYRCTLVRSGYGYGQPDFLRCSKRDGHNRHDPHGHHQYDDTFRCHIRPNRRYYEEGGHGYGRTHSHHRHGHGYREGHHNRRDYAYAGVVNDDPNYNPEYQPDYYGGRQSSRYIYGRNYGGAGYEHEARGYSNGDAYGYQYRNGYYGRRQKITCYRGGYSQYGEALQCTSLSRREYVCSEFSKGHGHYLNRLPFGLRDVNLNRGYHKHGQQAQKCGRQCEHQDVHGNEVKICSITCCKWYCPDQACYDAHCCRKKFHGDEHGLHHCLKKIDSCKGACYIKREEYDAKNKRYVYREEFGNRQGAERRKVYGIFNGFGKFQGDSAETSAEAEGNLNLANEEWF